MMYRNHYSTSFYFIFIKILQRLWYNKTYKETIYGKKRKKENCFKKKKNLF